MDTRILVPLDGSPLAETIIPDAVMLARRRSAGLLLLHVISRNPHGYRVGLTHMTMRPSDLGAPDPTAYLQDLRQRLTALDVAVETVIDEGDPALRILHHLEQVDSVQLVAMATHGQGGLRRWMMGSVADKVFRSVHKPLLLLRPGRATAEPTPDGRYQTILVPLDGSPTAARALGYAQELAGQMHARLVLLGVAPELEDLLLGVDDSVPLWTNDVLQEQKTALESYLRTTAALVASADLTVETRVESGLPTETILAICNEIQADLVVMASHGRSGFQRLWYGSVTTKIIHAASVPVLLINAGADPSQEGRTGRL